MPRLVQTNLAPAAGALCCYPARSLVGRLAICAVFRNDLRGLLNGNPVFLGERLGLVGLRGRGGVLLLCHDGFLEMTNQPRVVRALCRVSCVVCRSYGDEICGPQPARKAFKSWWHRFSLAFFGHRSGHLTLDTGVR